MQHPAAACFDNRGRLFVADSEAKCVSILEDTDGDGRFDKASVFTDKLDSPRGVLWHGGAVFVAGPTGLLRYRDTDGDGIADDRRVLLSGAEIRGVSVGPDRLVYACTGGAAEDLKDARGNPLYHGTAAMLVRCRPDGSAAEVVGGLPRNTTEVAWTAAGDAVAAGDTLAQVVESDDRDSGGPLPPLTRPGAGGATGPTSAILRYRGMIMGRSFTGEFLCADPERHEVRRYTLSKNGATFSASGEAFVSSDGPDFRPIDVLEDADGSVLIVDAGGAIFRVRRDNAVRLGDPRGHNVMWDHPPMIELARRLHDLRPCVADRAADELSRSGSEAIAQLTDTLTRTTNADARLHAAWALARSVAPLSAIPLRLALVDPSPPVRQAAAYGLGLRRDADSIPQLIAALGDDSPPVKREAANALGRIGNRPAAAPALDVPIAGPQNGPGPSPLALGPPGGVVIIAAPGDSPATAAPAATVVESAPVSSAPTSAPTSAPATTKPATQPGPATAPTTVPATAPAAAIAPVPPPPPSPAVPALLNVLRGGNADRFLEHAVVYALVRINDGPSTSRGLTDSDPDVQRGAKMALEAMGNAAPAPAR